MLPIFATLLEVKSVIDRLNYFETIGIKTETKLSLVDLDAHLKVGRENERHKR